MLISIVLNLIDLINLASRKFPFACSASFYHSRSLRFKWQKKKNNRRRTNDNDSRRQFSCCRHWCNKVNEYHSFVRGSRVRTSISGVGAIPIPNRKELRNQQKRERGEGAAGDDREVSLWHWLILPALSVARTLIHFHCCYLSVPIRREYFDRAYNLTRVYVQQSITVPMSSKRRNSMHWNVLWVPRRSVAAMNNKCNQWSVISVRVSRWSERRCGFFFSCFWHFVVVVEGGNAVGISWSLYISRASTSATNRNHCTGNDDDDDNDDWQIFNFQVYYYEQKVPAS